MSTDAAGEHREREHFFGAAKIISALTFLSRILGMVRDMAITAMGASRETGAFVVAFQIPNLFRRLFGEGALAGAFVPVFTETNETEGFDKARRLLANAMGLLSALLVGLLVLIELGLLGWHALWPGAWDRQLLVGLLAIMLPFMVTICLLALGSAALNCRGHFIYPAAAPMILNIAMIAAAWGAMGWFKEQVSQQLYVVASAVAAAGVIQLAAVLWLLRRSDFPVRPRLTPVESGIKPMLKLMAPMLVGLGFLQISPFFDSILIWVCTATQHSQTIDLLGWSLAKPLAESSQVEVYAAQRLYQFPMGVLAISLGVAVFPLMSRYAARNDLPNLRLAINRALRLAIMEGLATGTGLLVLAEPITRMIFLRGKFNEANIPGSASVLSMYVMGMWAYCSYQIFSRAFFAIKEPRTPMKVSAALVVVNMILVGSLIWVPALRASAVGLATAITAAVNVAILAVILRRRLGRFGGKALLVSTLRSLAASATMAAAILLIRSGMHGRSNTLTVALCVPAGAIVFLGVAKLLGSPELGELFGAFRKRKAQAVEEAVTK